MKTPMRAQRQQGVALLIALLILVVVSLMGITAMKTSMFSAKIATGTRVAAMAFGGAESAINATVTDLKAHRSRLQSLMIGGTQVQCVTMIDQGQSGACDVGDHLDSRGMVVAESHSRVTGYRPIKGSGVGTTGAGIVKVDYEISILGTAEIEDFKRNEYHLQEVLMRGLMPSSVIN